LAAAAVLPYVGYAGYLGYRCRACSGYRVTFSRQKQVATLGCTAEPVLPNRLVLAWLDVITASAGAFQASLGQAPSRRGDTPPFYLLFHRRELSREFR